MNERSERTAGRPNAAVEVLAHQFLLRTELRARRGRVGWSGCTTALLAPILRARTVHGRRRWRWMLRRGWAVGKDASRLYAGQQLKDAAAELEQHPEQHSEAERAFVDAGQARQAARNVPAAGCDRATVGLVLLSPRWRVWRSGNVVLANQATQQWGGISERPPRRKQRRLQLLRPQRWQRSRTLCKNASLLT